MQKKNRYDESYEAPQHSLGFPQLDRSYEQIIGPLENFRKEAIGGAKEGRKKFEKQTQKFCQSQERYLNLSTKKDDQVLQEVRLGRIFFRRGL